MLKMRKGCTVPFPEKLEEGYTEAEHRIVANVSADKIAAVMEHFICTRREPIFFILELPAKREAESEVRTGETEHFHKDIYYIDGCTADVASDILAEIGEIAINDGLCVFGFGGHDTNDEIMFAKYNVMTVYSPDIADFDGFFEAHGIPKKDSLITAWDTFSPDHAGKCERVITDGHDAYSIPSLLAAWGIYLAERREES